MRSTSPSAATRFSRPSDLRSTSGQTDTSYAQSTYSTTNPALYEGLISEARNLVQTNPHAAGFLDLMEAQVLGANGFNIEFTGGRGMGDVQSRWDEWSDRADIRGMSWRSFMTDAVRRLPRDGELLIQLVEVRTNASGEEIAPELKLVFRDPARLDWSHDIVGTASYGVLHDDRGRVTGYKFKDIAEPVPAANMFHVFRPGKGVGLRGVTWFRPVMSTLQNLGEFEKSFQIGARNKSNLPGFWTVPQTNVNQYLAKLNLDEEGQSKAIDQMDTDMVQMKPGIMKRMVEGTEFHPIDLGGVEGLEYETVKRGLLTSVANGLGPSYAGLSGDVSAANFSSLRVGWIRDVSFYRKVQGLLIDELLNPIIHAWLQWLMVNGEISSEIFERALTNVRFRPQQMPPIDPSRDATAVKTNIESGVTSRTSEIAKDGADPQQIFDELNREREMLGGGGETP